MRTIKFRGFHADKHGKTVIKLNGREIKGTWFYGDIHTDGPYINEHKVLPETVGQYSGIDDIRGKEIFEWDILRVIMGEKEFLHAVIIENGVFILKESGHLYLASLVRARFKIEVIGNIFESPELLEVEG